MTSVHGCIAVSPFLLSQLPMRAPSCCCAASLVPIIVEAERKSRDTKQNWVVFAGTHIESNGVASFIEGWKQLAIPGWELHITGHGHLTPALRAQRRVYPRSSFMGSSAETNSFVCCRLRRSVLIHIRSVRHQELCLPSRSSSTLRPART